MLPPHLEACAAPVEPRASGPFVVVAAGRARVRGPAPAGADVSIRVSRRTPGRRSAALDGASVGQVPSGGPPSPVDVAVGRHTLTSMTDVRPARGRRAFEVLTAP